MRMPFLTPMLCCALALLAAPAARGATWYVDAAAAPGGNGTSWAEAFNTVQAGADAAADTGGGEVWVKAGSYPEVQTNGGVSLTMRQRVGLYGGFAGTETARDQRNPELNVTVLVGTADSSDVLPVASVVLGANDSTLDGFLIRGGRASQGGGLLCFRTRPTVRGCIFEENRAIHDELIPGSGYGGAIMVVGGVTPLIENCLFRQNSGLLGGAITLENGKATIRNCTFEDNRAYLVTGPVPGVPPDLWQDQSGGGGAISGIDQAACIIEGCIFTNNIAETTGGAISFYNRCDATVRDSVFIGNKADRDPAIVGLFPGGRGGALEIQWDSSTFERCFFANNTSTNDGGAAFVAGLREELHPDFDPALLARSLANPTFTNCIFVGNTSAGTGGALMLFEAQTTLLNCTMTGNTALREDGNTGGGIYALNFATPTLKNSILWGTPPSTSSTFPRLNSIRARAIRSSSLEVRPFQVSATWATSLVPLRTSRPKGC